MARKAIHAYDRMSRQLVVQHRNGDATAFARLSKLHVRLIENAVTACIGKRTAANYHFCDDLRQEGFMALADALRPGFYDPDTTAFSTYVRKAALRRMQKYRNRNIGLITTPLRIKTDELGVRAHKIRHYANLQKSSSEAVYEEAASLSIYNLQSSFDTFQTVADADVFHHRYRLVTAALDILTDTQRAIVLAVAESEPYDTIGKRYGLSSSEARQRYKTAIGQLQRHIKKQGYSVNPEAEARAQYKKQWLKNQRARTATPCPCSV